MINFNITTREYCGSAPQPAHQKQLIYLERDKLIWKKKLTINIMGWLFPLLVWDMPSSSTCGSLVLCLLPYSVFLFVSDTWSLWLLWFLDLVVLLLLLVVGSSLCWMLWPMCITAHLSMLKFICQVFDQSTTLLRSSCNSRTSSGFLELWQSFVSSANLNILLTMLLSRSLMYVDEEKQWAQNTFLWYTWCHWCPAAEGLVDANPLAPSC